MTRPVVFGSFLSHMYFTSTLQKHNKISLVSRGSLGLLLRISSSSARYVSTSSVKRNLDRDAAREQRHRREKRLVAAMIGSAVGFIGSSYVLYRKLTKVKAEGKTTSSIGSNTNNTTEANQEDDDVATNGKKKKHKHGFRERRIIEYENRIRQYSTPDKVFRYFATLKVINLGELNDVFMRPEDFVRSLTPGNIQPEGLGLDEHERFNPEKHKYKGGLSENLGEDSVFMKMGEFGLISFSDYIFLLTVLSLPPRMYEIAFQMFDLNGDGEVSPEEFDKVQSILFSMTQTGIRHRDHAVTGSVLSDQVNSGLKEYFFGKSMDKRLTAKGFIEFQKKLQKEVMYLEFMTYKPVNGKITEWEFADMLLTYSSFHEKKKQRILQKVKRAFKEDSQGITFKDYLDFFIFMRNISDAEMALSFHHAAGKAVDPETLKHVAKTVAHVQLGDNVVDVVYKMFDENDDGVLSHKEFIVVIKNQLVRGLENPKDTGFGRLVQAVWHCTKHHTYKKLYPKKSIDV